MTWVAAAIAGGAVVGAVASGSASKGASKAQQNAANTAAAQLDKSTAAARKDLFKLFPAAQDNAMQGYQGALDVFNQALPQQSDIYQQGNVAAQNQLINAMPQFQNAILGGAVDYSQFQPTTLEQPDFSFANQQLSYGDPYDPLYGMTNDQIQAATATQPPAPAGTGASNVSITDQMNGGGQLGGQYGPAAPSLGGRWAASKYRPNTIWR